MLNIFKQTYFAFLSISHHRVKTFDVNFLLLLSTQIHITHCKTRLHNECYYIAIDWSSYFGAYRFKCSLLVNIVFK